MSIKKIISILFTAGLLLVSATATCCSCGGRERSLKEIFEQSNFVAYVKVIRKEALTATDSGRIKTGYLMSETVRLVYQIKEMFKGDSTFSLYEWGVNTSCDMGIMEGSDWIFFGSGKDPGFSSINYCGKWIPIRAADGQQAYSYNTGMQTLKELRNLMQLPAKPQKNGRSVYYYSNGKIESESFYKDDKLDKEQVLYYSNGRIRSLNHFKEGIPHGQQKEFAVSGQLLSDTWYANNEWLSRKDWYDTSFEQRRWYLLMEMDRMPRGKADLDTMLNRYIIPIQLRSEYEYDSTMRKSISKKYNWNGLLEELTTGDQRNDTQLTYRYHPNGKISGEIFTRRADQWTEEKYWDIQGKLIRHKTWQNGKYLGDQVQQ